MKIWIDDNDVAVDNEDSFRPLKVRQIRQKSEFME